MRGRPANQYLLAFPVRHPAGRLPVSTCMSRWLTPAIAPLNNHEVFKKMAVTRGENRWMGRRGGWHTLGMAKMCHCFEEDSAGSPSIGRRWMNLRTFLALNATSNSSENLPRLRWVKGDQLRSKVICPYAGTWSALIPHLNSNLNWYERLLYVNFALEILKFWVRLSAFA